jgi:hypothetical protein
VAARAAFEWRVRAGAAAGTAPGPSVGLEVFAFSSEHDLPEQVACLRSFLEHVGEPKEFTIVSDGSHSRESAEVLRSVHGCVSVVSWDQLINPDLPREVWAYADHSWQGKKLAMSVSLPRDRPVLYCDSDILFFPGASELREPGTGSRCLLDVGARPYLDDRLLHDKREAKPGINSGFYFHSRGLDFGPALERIEGLTEWRTFTEQTVVHLALRQAGARPLDRARYVMANADGSKLDDRYVRPDTVLRHYTTRVRHKFWLAPAGDQA